MTTSRLHAALSLAQVALLAALLAGCIPIGFRGSSLSIVGASAPAPVAAAAAR